MWYPDGKDSVVVISSTTDTIIELMESSAKIPIRAAQLLGYFPLTIVKVQKCLTPKINWLSFPFALLFVHLACDVAAQIWRMFFLPTLWLLFEIENGLEMLAWETILWIQLATSIFFRLFMLSRQKRVTNFLQGVYSEIENIATEFKGNGKLKNLINKNLIICCTISFLAMFELGISVWLHAATFISRNYLGLSDGEIIIISLVNSISNTTSLLRIVPLLFYVYIIHILKLGFELLKVANEKMNDEEAQIICEGNQTGGIGLGDEVRSNSSIIVEKHFKVFMTHFQALENLVDEFNKIFGIPLLLHLLSNVVTLMNYIFYTIAKLDRGGANIVEAIPTFISPIIVLVLGIYLVCIASANLTNEARQSVFSPTSDYLENMSTGSYRKFQQFYQKVFNLPPSISAGGYFIVNRNLIMSIFGVLITYCIILIQFRWR